LSQLGISCVVNSPFVGQNLQDQTYLPLVMQLPAADFTDLIIDFLFATNSAGFPIGGFYKSQYAAQYTDPLGSSSPVTDGQFVWNSASFLESNLNEMFNFNYIDPITGQFLTPPVMTLGVVNMRPKCRGQVVLSSNDPLVPPNVETNYFCDTSGPSGQSLDRLWHEQASRDMFQMVQYMASHNSSSFVALLPNAAQVANVTLLDRVINSLLGTSFHPTGTCRMGSFNNVQQGVVDGNLCVHGTSGLRVADASIMPVTTSGNTQAPTYVIGATAARLIHTTTCGNHHEDR